MGIQIANYHISNYSHIKGDGSVFISSQAAGDRSGFFKVVVDVTFDPALQDYPTGNVQIDLDLTESIVGSVRSGTIDQVNSFGEKTPTAVITGVCEVISDNSGRVPKGCRFWLLIANNMRADKETPDVVSFIVYDRDGKRVSYGTGPLDGHIPIDSTAI